MFYDSKILFIDFIGRKQEISVTLGCKSALWRQYIKIAATLN